MPKIEKTCECGKTFTTYPSVNKRHCSQACSSRYVPRKPRLGETVPCAVCGTQVYANKSQRAKGQGRFCSIECHNLAQTKEPGVKHCVCCGKEMRLKPSEAARTYCSKECEGQGRTLRPLSRTHNGKPARLDSHGYVLVWEPTHPNASFHGWQYEHRLIVERALGRLLRTDEAVHHMNGAKDDNRLENLEVMDAVTHATLSVRDFWTMIERERTELAEYRRRYGP